MRIGFMGTPDFAASILEAIVQARPDEVIAVYAQPDRPAGRGKKMRPPAVKVLAQQLNLPIFQPLNFKDPAALEELAALKPDVLVVAAYGLLLPQALLDIPPLGVYNVHASLLPKYRGAAPIQRAIINGDSISGISIMRLEAGLDSGPVLLQQAVSIAPEDDAGSLFEVLAQHGAKLMLGALGMIEEGRIALTPQNPDQVSYAAKLGREDEIIDWNQPARQIHNQIRGLSPKPGARTLLLCPDSEDLALQILPGEVMEEEAPAGSQPGQIVAWDGQALYLACGQGQYKISQLRPAGKNTMSARDFVNGRKSKDQQFPRESRLGRAGT